MRHFISVMLELLVSDQTGNNVVTIVGHHHRVILKLSIGVVAFISI
jgi:hypothetical protein